MTPTDFNSIYKGRGQTDAIIEAGKEKVAEWYWQHELWQVLRFHHNTTRCVIVFSPDYGVEMWRVSIYYREELIHFDQGVHLSKRLKSATYKLKDFFGDKSFTYESL